MVVQTAALRVTLRPTLVSVLVVLTLGCAAPGLMGAQQAQPTFPPPKPGPQGVVEVYSERYVLYEKTVPLFRRRPVDRHCQVNGSRPDSTPIYCHHDFL